jgi:hypothetical protein
LAFAKSCPTLFDSLINNPGAFLIFFVPILKFTLSFKFIAPLQVPISAPNGAL